MFRSGIKKDAKYANQIHAQSFRSEFKLPKSDLKTRNLEDFFELINLKMYEVHLNLNDVVCGKLR